MPARWLESLTMNASADDYNAHIPFTLPSDAQSACVPLLCKLVSSLGSQGNDQQIRAACRAVK